MRSTCLLLLVCLMIPTAWGWCTDAELATAPAPTQWASNPSATKIRSVELYGAVVGGEGALRAGETFSVNSVYSLQIRVVWQQIPDGLHVLQIRFTTPEGTTYETKATPFVVRSRNRQSMSATLKDVVHPVSAQFSRTIPGVGEEVWGELLMAGTWAQRLPGKWKMDVLLDGTPTVYQSKSFTLQAGGTSQ